MPVSFCHAKMPVVVLTELAATYAKRAPGRGSARSAARRFAHSRSLSHQQGKLPPFQNRCLSKLQAFPDIDSTQLNRHTSCITELYDKTADEKSQNMEKPGICPWSRREVYLDNTMEKQDKVVDYAAEVLTRLGFARILMTVFIAILLFRTPNLMQYYGTSHSDTTTAKATMDE